MSNEELNLKLALFARGELIRSAKSIRTSIEKLGEAHLGTFGPYKADLAKAIKGINMFLMEQAQALNELETMAQLKK